MIPRFPAFLMSLGPFAAPAMLWLLAALVVPLCGFLWWAWRRRQQLITRFISARLVALLKVGVSPARQKFRMALIVLSVVCIILALARPQWGSSNEEVRQRGVDIIVAIDTSNSMLAEDAPPNRLARAKLAALDLMKKAKSDRLGLVAFAGSAFLQCPLTLDETAFAQSVNALDTKTFSQGGTAIAEAIDEARKTFKIESENHKVVVLFTDGEDHDSDAIEAAKAAAKEGIIIHTIGIGSADGEKLRIRDERGHVDYIRDENGEPVVSKLDEGLLKSIARATPGGIYAPLRADTVEKIYDAGIAPLPKTEGTTRMFKRLKEQYQWPLGAAIALLIWEMFFPDHNKKSPRPATTPVSAATATAALLALALMLPAKGVCGPGAALREYNKGDYEDALKHYQELLDKKNNDPRLHFNAGDAAYQSRQLEKAEKEFQEALTSPDIQLQQRAYYNLANTYYRMGQQSQEPEKKQESWENALKNYESALKLSPQDKDAAFNQDFVKKQLEELKKQQPPKQSQQNKDKNQKQDKDKQDQNGQQSQDNQQDKQKQDKQNDQQAQNQQDKNSQQQKQDQQSKEDRQKQQQQASGKPGDDQKKQKEKQEAAKKEREKEEKEAAAAGEPKEDQQSPEDARKEAAMMAAGQMTPSQAKQLLDMHKNDDKVFIFSPTNQNLGQTRYYKNW